VPEGRFMGLEKLKKAMPVKNKGCLLGVVSETGYFCTLERRAWPVALYCLPPVGNDVAFA